VSIAFSGFGDEASARHKKLVHTLHGKVADEVGLMAQSCTHIVVARPVKRTTKLCVGVSLPGAVIVTDEWIKACGK
jgi:hypothetical protein